MNDPFIRKAFHTNFLQKEHCDPNTLVIDELGIKHGKSRVDIAVINGCIHGYEIKSDDDSLYRLGKQIEYYNKVLDKISIVLTERHLQQAMSMIPKWWGIILVNSDNEGDITFKLIRQHHQNNTIDNYAVVQLLWRNEALEILQNLGIQGSILQQNRANLYANLLEMVSAEDLKYLVMNYLKNRKNWRSPERLVQYGG